MALFDSCLLVSDVDGTLVGSGEKMAPYNLERIKYFIDNGGFFTMATGRCVSACRELIKKFQIPLSAPVAAANGAVIYDFQSETVVGSAPIDDKAREVIVEFSKENNPFVGIEIHSRDKVIDATVTKEIEIHNFFEGLEPLFMSCEEAFEYEWNKVFFTFEKGFTREQLKEIFVSRGIPSEQICFTNASLDDGIHDYLEVLPLGSDKGTGIKMLADKLGIDIKDVYGIGDFYNDIPMLKTVGHPAVVADAPKEIEQMAEFVSLPVMDGAVGRLVDYIEERIKANEQ